MTEPNRGDALQPPPPPELVAAPPEPAQPQQPTTENPNNPSMTRRDFLNFGAKIAGVAVAGGFLANTLKDAFASHAPQAPTETPNPSQSPAPDQSIAPSQSIEPVEPSPTVAPTPSEGLKSPEVFGPGIEYGFNTHVHAISLGENDNMTPEAFKNDVDTLVQNKQQWIRFNFINDGVVQMNPDGSVGFTEKVAVFDQAIAYAKEKGLKVALVTNVPESAGSMPLDQYIGVAKDFYTKLFSHFKEQGIDLSENDSIQIVQNEANTHNRTYGGIETPDDAYLNELIQTAEASSSAIRATNSKVKITMNAGMGFGAGNHQKVLDETARFFDAVAPYLDIISIDPYPDIHDPSSFQLIPKDIEFFSKRYNKDVVVAEIGASTRDTNALGVSKADVILGQIAAIKSGNVQPKAVYIYEIDNENAKAENDKERYFGTKEIMPQLLTQMQPTEPQSQSPAPSPSA